MNLKELEARVTLKHETEKVNVCYSKDIKEKILEFEEYLKSNLYSTNEINKCSSLEIKEDLELYNELTLIELKKFKEIFGE